jgi:pimeloyl-ACP methyl ester carboxylesterase
VPGVPVTGKVNVEQRGPKGPVPPGLDKFYSQSLAWGDCESYENDETSEQLFGGDGLQCARMRVPIDYAKPDGPNATIGLLRKPGTDQAGRIGSLVLNPGGPGQSGMVAAAGIAQEGWSDELARRFDLVGFDPRGVGASEPKVKCLSDQQKDAERLEPPNEGASPEVVAKVENKNREFAAGCAANTNKDLLANIGTRDVVRDLDVLKSVLGDEKLTYLGFSYGTSIGTVYAEAFPGNVRAMLLDGAVSPVGDRVTGISGQLNGFLKAFQEFAKSCARKPDCPVGTDPAAAEAKLDALFGPLKTKPLDVDGRKLSYMDASTAVMQGLYSEELWETLTVAIQQFAEDGDGEVLLKIADYYLGRDADGTYSPAQDAFTAIQCVDEPPVKDRAVVADQVRRITEAIPKSVLGIADGLVPALDECAFWPVPNTRTPHEPKVPGLPKLLVVSTTGDPATPHQWGLDLSKALGASLLTVQGISHTAFLQDNKCVDRAGTDYLISLKLPAEGTTCQ